MIVTHELIVQTSCLPVVSSIVFQRMRIISGFNQHHILQIPSIPLICLFVKLQIG